MADVARTPAELRAALHHALARGPRTPDRSYERLPHAADEVLRTLRLGGQSPESHATGGTVP
jgi:hypothetical protein